MEYLKEKISEYKDIWSIEEYIKKWKEEKLQKLVDNLLEREWIEDEKCSWTKVKIWEVNNSSIYIYNISEKYIKNNSCTIYIFIWLIRKSKYKLDFNFNLSNMYTWDYNEETSLRIKNIKLNKNIFIQDKKIKNGILCEN